MKQHKRAHRILVLVLAAACLLQPAVPANATGPDGREPVVFTADGAPETEITQAPEKVPEVEPAEEAGPAPPEEETGGGEVPGGEAEHGETDPSGEDTADEPGQEQQEPGEDNQANAIYSADALRALLEELAAELGIEEDELIDWLLKSDCFSEKTRKDIYGALTENRERAQGFFGSTRELYEQYHTDEDTRPLRENTGPDGIEDILQAGERLIRAGEAAARSGRTGGAADNLLETPIEDDPYLRALTRFARTRTGEDNGEVYRHYEMGLGFEVTAPGWGKEADIVLVIDNSASTRSALPAIRAAAESFVSRPEVTGSGSRIALVTFSNGAEILMPLTDAAGEDGGPNKELLEAIAAIESADMSNLQAGLIKARSAFELDDESFPEDGRTRAAVLLSDGEANYRFTDIWRFRAEFEGNTTTWVYDIDVEWGGEAVAGAKRWTYLVQEMAAGRVYLDGGRIGAGLHGQGNASLARNAARLEAQYLVGQGVDLYAVDYSGGKQNSYLRSLTLCMESGSDFSAGIDRPAYEVPVRAGRNYDGNRVFDPAGEDAVGELVEAILDPSRAALPVFTLTDTLSDGFEWDDAFEWAVLNGDGQELDAGGWELHTGGEDVLRWTTPAGLAPGQYMIRYGVRVKDDEADPLRYYPDGSELSPSSRAAIRHGGEAFDYDQAEVTVPPLLGITAEGPEAAFVGETVQLTGAIFRGNGAYAYRWLDSDGETPLAGGAVPVDGIDPAEGLGLNIPVPAYSETARVQGTLRRILEVTDIRAWDAGYSGGRLRAEAEVTVVDGVLTIHVIGEDGAVYGGRFETTIRRTREGEPDERYHFMGPGTASYDTSTGLRQGRYEITVYVPYGYRAVEDVLAVEIAPERDAQGNWAGCERTVNIHLERTWPRYFYGWTARTIRQLAGLITGKEAGAA